MRIAASARRANGVRLIGKPSLFNALECGTVIGFNGVPRGVEHLPTWNYDNIYAGQWSMRSEQLADQAFCPVSPDRVSNFLAGRNAEAGRSDLISQSEAGHEPAPKTDALFEDLGKLRPSAQFHLDDETLRRLRPLARRRLSTIRPFFVCIRTRNPWVRRRRRRLG
jgi:hypothetical protein